jgi:hypothetical protein
MTFTEGICAKNYEYIPSVPNYMPQTSLKEHKVKTNPEVVIDVDCPYCREKDAQDIFYDGEIFIYVNPAGYLRYGNSDGVGGIEIGFCPMCGREL